VSDVFNDDDGNDFTFGERGVKLLHDGSFW
jgi:hypothetical protein